MAKLPTIKEMAEEVAKEALKIIYTEKPELKEIKEAYEESIRANERAKVIDLIERHLWNYSKEAWVDFQPVLEKLKEQK